MRYDEGDSYLYVHHNPEHLTKALELVNEKHHGPHYYEVEIEGIDPHDDESYLYKQPQPPSGMIRPKAELPSKQPDLPKRREKDHEEWEQHYARHGKV